VWLDFVLTPDSLHGRLGDTKLASHRAASSSYPALRWPGCLIDDLAQQVRADLAFAARAWLVLQRPQSPLGDSAVSTSAILPKYMRRAPSVDALLPALYLKGISTGDFSEALTAILGEGTSGLSATNIVRLKSSWETEYKVWTQRDLSAKRTFIGGTTASISTSDSAKSENLCAGLDRSR
jgi:hypothetical protein